MWLKMCPKCSGDLYLRADTLCREIACLQCGKILSPHEEVWLMAQLSQQKNEEQLAA